MSELINPREMAERINAFLRCASRGESISIDFGEEEWRVIVACLALGDAMIPLDDWDFVRRGPAPKDQVRRRDEALARFRFVVRK